MSALSRIVAVLLFVAAFIAMNAAPQARAHHYAPADEVRAMLVDAYVFGGWSQRDSESIADIKVERMINLEADGPIPDFVPQDPRGRLSESSSGLAVIANMLVAEFEWDFSASMESVLQMYSDLNGWGGPNLQGPGSIGCKGYSIRYEYCVDGQLVEMQAFWNGPCTFNNFVNNNCVAHTFDCCPAGPHAPTCICSAEYTPSGACLGVPAESCMRIVEIRQLPNRIPCNNFVKDDDGGCKDCSPPQSFQTDCPVPVLAACVSAMNCPCAGSGEPCEEDED